MKRNLYAFLAWAYSTGMFSAWTLLFGLDRGAAMAWVAFSFPAILIGGMIGQALDEEVI